MIIFLYSPHYFSDSRCRLVSQLLARKLTFQITVAMRIANVHSRTDDEGNYPTFTGINESKESSILVEESRIHYGFF